MKKIIVLGILMMAMSGFCQPGKYDVLYVTNLFVGKYGTTNRGSLKLVSPAVGTNGYIMIAAPDGYLGPVPSMRFFTNSLLSIAYATRFDGAMDLNGEFDQFGDAILRGAVYSGSYIFNSNGVVSPSITLMNGVQEGTLTLSGQGIHFGTNATIENSQIDIFGNEVINPLVMVARNIMTTNGMSLSNMTSVATAMLDSTGFNLGYGGTNQLSVRTNRVAVLNEITAPTAYITNQNTTTLNLTNLTVNGAAPLSATITFWSTNKAAAGLVSNSVVITSGLIMSWTQTAY